VNPRDILGAGTENLDSRFTGLDASIRENIMEDMQAEDVSFKILIDTCRLDRWHQSALELAKAHFEAELAEETDGGNLMRDADDKLEQLEMDIKEKERQNADNLLHSKPKYKAKARLSSAARFRSSVRQY
jgi:nuclear pore complex protein Nup133